MGILKLWSSSVSGRCDRDNCLISADRRHQESNRAKAPALVGFLQILWTPLFTSKIQLHKFQLGENGCCHAHAQSAPCTSVILPVRNGDFQFERGGKSPNPIWWMPAWNASALKPILHILGVVPIVSESWYGSFLGRNILVKLNCPRTKRSGSVFSSL